MVADLLQSFLSVLERVNLRSSMSGLSTVSHAFENLMQDNLMHLMGFPGGSDGKESACSAGNLGLITR